MITCLRCDTVTDWDDDDVCPNCGYTEGLDMDDEEQDDE